MKPIEVTISIRTVTGLNARECWQAKHRRTKAHRSAARMLLGPASMGAAALKEWPLIVTLTRIGPRECDGDNLQGALKAIRDGVADWLGCDDADRRIGWRYKQARGPWGVRVRIEAMDPGAYEKPIEAKQTCPNCHQPIDEVLTSCPPMMKDITAPKTMTELRDDLLEMYAEIGHGQIRLDMAKEKSNAAGKIIKSAAVQLEYATSRKEKPEIPFLK